MTTARQALTRAEAVDRAALISDVAYRVHLDLTTGDTKFGTTTHVTFRASRPGAGTFLDLVAAAVERVECNGRELGPEAFAGDRVHLDDLAEHNEVLVVARGSYENTGAGLSRFVDPVDGAVYLHTQFEPFDAHRVLACFDQPDLKATFALDVAAPEGWVVVSNAAPVERPPQARGADRRGARSHAGTWRFPVSWPMSTYLLAVVAGPYAELRDRHGDIDLGLYCRRSLLEHLDADELFEITRQGLDYFQTSFDFAYPFGDRGADGSGARLKYDQVFVPEFRAGAMENPGCVTWSEAYVFRGAATDAQRENRAGTVLHEMAHMWFGDLVTMRWWDDLWLNESFATYMGTRAVAEATRFTGAWVRFASGKTGTYAADQLPSTHPISADIADTEALWLHFDRITYGKGAAVLRQLAAWVGREAFDAGVRRYFADHAWGNATLADFLGALEAASGRDLVAWSKEWLQTAGVNTLRPAFDVADGSYARFTVEQSAPDDHRTLRSHRVGVGLFDRRGGSLTRREPVELDVTGASSPVEAAVGAPAADLVLVNDGDLAYAKVRLDPGSFAALAEDMAALDDPLARTLCYAAAADMVRDAELPARDFAALVARHAHAEDDPTTVGRLFAEAREGIDAYGDPANRAAARATLAQRAAEQLASAPAGSDAQLVWAQQWISLADGPDDLARAQRLLDGSEDVDGLAVDLDLRWRLVGVLVNRGAAGPDLAEAEARRDPTDLGRRRADAILAGRADEAAKEHAWTVATADETPLATRRAVASGFDRADQLELLRPWVARYVAEFASWFDRFGGDIGVLVGRGLFPSAVVEPDAIAALRELRDSGALSVPARRVVAEGVDDLERGLRARAVDAAAS